MSEADAESNELEAEIMASFLLRPVIVHESIYAIYSTWKAMSAFEFSLIKTEGCLWRIFIQNLRWMASFKSKLLLVLKSVNFCVLFELWEKAKESYSSIINII